MKNLKNSKSAGACKSVDSGIGMQELLLAENQLCIPETYSEGKPASGYQSLNTDSKVYSACLIAEWQSPFSVI